MVLEENFLRLTATVKKKELQRREFSDPFFKSTGHNNVAVTKQIYFSPTF